LTGLHKKLRARTEAIHRALDERPMFAALAAGDLPLEAYVTWLRALAVFYGALERAWERCPDTQIRGLWDRRYEKLTSLREDLARVDHVAKHASMYLGPTMALAETLLAWGRDDPPALVGAVYVLEGATLGATVLEPQVREHRERAGLGDSYLSAYGGNVKRRWRTLCDGIDALQLTQAEEVRALDAAARVFAGVDAAVATMHPFTMETQAPVYQLNTQAGQHPITTDPRELLAAVAAGESTWETFPYFQARYGERGRRFTRSDSAWLVTLCDHSPAARHRHIDWLARLLSSRGMPTLLLESHLTSLHKALVREVPERRDTYEALAEAARALGVRRLTAISVDTFDALAASFPHDAPLTNVGPMLVSAVADECNGHADAVASLTSWLADPDRFPLPWCAAVHALVEAARTRRGVDQR